MIAAREQLCKAPLGTSQVPLSRYAAAIWITSFLISRRRSAYSWVTLGTPPPLAHSLLRVRTTSRRRRASFSQPPLHLQRRINLSQLVEDYVFDGRYSPNDDHSLMPD